MVWTIFENLRGQKNLNIEKIIFKVVQIKFTAMHITKFWYIYIRTFTKCHDLNILMIFGIKEKQFFLLIQCIVGYFYKYTSRLLLCSTYVDVLEACVHLRVKMSSCDNYEKFWNKFDFFLVWNRKWEIQNAVYERYYEEKSRFYFNSSR